MKNVKHKIKDSLDYGGFFELPHILNHPCHTEMRKVWSNVVLNIKPPILIRFIK